MIDDPWDANDANVPRVRDNRTEEERLEDVRANSAPRMRLQRPWVLPASRARDVLDRRLHSVGDARCVTCPQRLRSRGLAP